MKRFPNQALRQVQGGGNFWQKLMDFVHDYGRMQLEGYSYQLKLFKNHRSPRSSGYQ